MKDLTVLVTACGAEFMPGLANCLKDNGERAIKIVGTDKQNDGTMLQIVDVFYQVPSVQDPNYVDALLDICKKESVDVLLPFMSAELLALIKRQSEFEKIGTKVSVSDPKSVEITTNKYKFYEFLKNNGINTPKYAKVSKWSELRQACFECGYPKNGVCVKATELNGSRGIRVINPNLSRFDILFNEKPSSFLTTLDDLESVLKERGTMPEMMAMEYLPGIEGSVDLIADNGRILYMAYRESTVNLHSIPQLAVIKENKEAFNIATKVISALGLSGSADLDFKEDINGHPVLMEINPRLAATLRIFKEGGLNLPYLRVKQLLGEDLPKITIKNNVTMRRRYLESFSK